MTRSNELESGAEWVAGDGTMTKWYVKCRLQYSTTAALVTAGLRGNGTRLILPTFLTTDYQPGAPVRHSFSGCTRLLHLKHLDLLPSPLGVLGLEHGVGDSLVEMLHLQHFQKVFVLLDKVRQPSHLPPDDRFWLPSDLYHKHSVADSLGISNWVITDIITNIIIITRSFL